MTRLLEMQRAPLHGATRFGRRRHRIHRSRPHRGAASARQTGRRHPRFFAGKKADRWRTGSASTAATPTTRNCLLIQTYPLGILHHPTGITTTSAGSRRIGCCTTPISTGASWPNRAASFGPFHHDPRQRDHRDARPCPARRGAHRCQHTRHCPEEQPHSRIREGDGRRQTLIGALRRPNRRGT